MKAFYWDWINNNLETLFHKYGRFLTLQRFSRYLSYLYLNEQIKLRVLDESDSQKILNDLQRNFLKLKMLRLKKKDSKSFEPIVHFKQTDGYWRRHKIWTPFSELSSWYFVESRKTLIKKYNKLIYC